MLVLPLLWRGIRAPPHCSQVGRDPGSTLSSVDTQLRWEEGGDSCFFRAGVGVQGPYWAPTNTSLPRRGRNVSLLLPTWPPRHHGITVNSNKSLESSEASCDTVASWRGGQTSCSCQVGVAVPALCVVSILTSGWGGLITSQQG